MQPAQVPLELREMIINSTKEDPPTKDTEKTTHTTLSTHSLSDMREIQMADPIIRRFHFYCQEIRNLPLKKEDGKHKML